MEYVVIGHPRGGTAYMAKLFQNAGIDVQHEKLGVCGISSWMWAVKAEKVPWGPPWRGDTIDFLIHVIRDPIPSISSIVAKEKPSEGWRRRYVDIPVDGNAVQRAIASYCRWHRLCKARNPEATLRLQDAHMWLQVWVGDNMEDPGVVHQSHSKQLELDLIKEKAGPHWWAILERFCEEFELPIQ